MASKVNIDDLNYEELIRLNAKLREKILSSENSETSLKMDNKRNEEIYLRGGITNIAFESSTDNRNVDIRGNTASGSSTRVRNNNQNLTKHPIQRMSCPPPIPPVNDSKIMSENDLPVYDCDAISLRSTKSNSTNKRMTCPPPPPPGKESKIMLEKYFSVYDCNANSPRSTRSNCTENEVIPIPIPTPRTKMHYPILSGIEVFKSNCIMKVEYEENTLLENDVSGIRTEDEILTSELLQEFLSLNVDAISNKNSVKVPSRIDYIRTKFSLSNIPKLLPKSKVTKPANLPPRLTSNSHSPIMSRVHQEYSLGKRDSMKSETYSSTVHNIDNISLRDITEDPMKVDNIRNILSTRSTTTVLPELTKIIPPNIPPRSKEKDPSPIISRVHQEYSLGNMGVVKLKTYSSNVPSIGNIPRSDFSENDLKSVDYLRHKFSMRSATRDLPELPKIISPNIPPQPKEKGLSPIISRVHQEDSLGNMRAVKLKTYNSNVPSIGNIPRSDFSEYDLKSVDYLRHKFSMRSTTRDLPEGMSEFRPELPPRPKLKEIIDPSSDIIRGISFLSKEAIVSLEQKEVSNNNLRRYNASIEKSSLSNNLVDDYEDEAIYEIIPGNIDEPKPIWAQYEDGEVYNDCPPPVPPKSKSLLSKASMSSSFRRSDDETGSETSSVNSDTTRLYVPYQGNRAYVSCYPTPDGSMLDEVNFGAKKHEKYKEALEQFNESEIKYIEQLEEIFGIYLQNIGKADGAQINAIFGQIQKLLNFHKEFIRQLQLCPNIKQIGKLIIKMEDGFGIYIRDQWCKLAKFTTNKEEVSIFVPYQNWTGRHLSLYDHLLKQLLDDNDPDIKMASIFIEELIRQCEAIHWLKNITKFPKIQAAGKYLIKDRFRVKINSTDRKICDVILMEKYMLCVSPDKNDCIYYLNTSKISMETKGPKTLIIENILKDKKLSLKSNDAHVIETWLNRYLSLNH